MHLGFRPLWHIAKRRFKHSSLGATGLTLLISVLWGYLLDQCAAPGGYVARSRVTPAWPRRMHAIGRIAMISCQ